MSRDQWADLLWLALGCVTITLAGLAVGHAILQAVLR